MKSTLVLVTPPEAEPVTLEEARAHLRVDPFGQPAAHPDDELIAGLITAARQRLDGAVAAGMANTGWLGRALVTQTWDLLLPAFPRWGITIPLPPLQEVVHVKYLDGAGEEQTLADSPAEYLVNPGEPAVLIPLVGGCWPVTLDAGYGRTDVVRVRFIAGYPPVDSPEDLAGNVPAPIKSAIKIMVEDLYANRGEQVVGTIASSMKTVDALLFPYRMHW